MSALSPSRHRELVQGGPTFQSSSCSPQGVPVSPAHSKLGQAEGISGSLWVHSLSCSMGAEGQQEPQGGLCSPRSLQHFILRDTVPLLCLLWGLCPSASPQELRTCALCPAASAVGGSDTHG